MNRHVHGGRNVSAILFSAVCGCRAALSRHQYPDRGDAGRTGHLDNRYKVQTLDIDGQDIDLAVSSGERKSLMSPIVGQFELEMAPFASTSADECERLHYPFLAWIDGLRDDDPDSIVTYGKTSRRNHDRRKGRNPLHLVLAGRRGSGSCSDKPRTHPGCCYSCLLASSRASAWKLPVSNLDVASEYH
jgi:hypothetical protein